MVMLSLSMIVRNEEARLGACLASVKGFVDEMVVVDTGWRTARSPSPKPLVHGGTDSLARRLRPCAEHRLTF